MERPVKSSGRFINFCAFVAVVLIALSLGLSRINVMGSVAGAFGLIAEAVAYFVVSVVSFFYVAKRKNVWIWLIWIAAIVLIVVFYVLGITL